MDIQRRIVRAEDIIDRTFKPALKTLRFRFEKTPDAPLAIRKLSEQEIDEKEQLLETAKSQMRIALKRYDESTKLLSDAGQLRDDFEKAEKTVLGIFRGSSGDPEIMQGMRGSMGELRKIRTVRGTEEPSRAAKKEESPETKPGIFGGILKRFRK